MCLSRDFLLQVTIITSCSCSEFLASQFRSSCSDETFTRFSFGMIMACNPVVLILLYRIKRPLAQTWPSQFLSALPSSMPIAVNFRNEPFVDLRSKMLNCHSRPIAAVCLSIMINIHIFKSRSSKTAI